MYWVGLNNNVCGRINRYLVFFKNPQKKKPHRSILTMRERERQLSLKNMMRISLIYNCQLGLQNKLTVFLQNSNYPFFNECLGYDTRLHLMVGYQSWSFGEYRVFLHWTEVIVPVRVQSVGQILLFNHLLRFIIISYLKPCDSVQNVYIE